MPTRQEVYEAINSETEFQNQHYRSLGKNPEDRGSIQSILLVLDRLARGLEHEITTNGSPEDEKVIIPIRRMAELFVVFMEKHGAPKREIPEALHND